MFLKWEAMIREMVGYVLLIYDASYVRVMHIDMLVEINCIVTIYLSIYRIYSIYIE